MSAVKCGWGKRYFYLPILKLNPLKIILCETAARKLDFVASEQKQAYLTVEIVTDNPTSGKVSIPQLVAVAEQTGLCLTWSQPHYLCQHASVSTLHAN